MEKEQLYQTIEAYLDGELRPEEQARFEQELAADSALATEVELHRRLQDQLGDPARTELRYLLEEISQEFIDPPTETGSSPDSSPTPPAGNGIPFWWWGLAIFLFIGGGVFWYLQDSKSDTVNSPIEIVEDEAPVSDPVEEIEITPEEPEEVPVAAEPAPPPPKPTPAQAYDTNRDLELLVDTEASKRYNFTNSSLTYALQGQRAFLSFSGKLTTARPTDEGFFLNIYTNKYPEGRVARYPLTIQEVKDPAQAFATREYFLGYNGETTLPPALYYGVITIGKSGIPLWVGKVRVDK